MSTKAPAIGSYRDLAKILLWRDLPDADDDTPPTYTLVGTAWCSIDPASIFGGGATMVDTDIAVDERPTHVAKMRFRTDITTEHVLDVNGQRYRVRRVRQDDRRRYTEAELELFGNPARVTTGPIVFDA